MSPQVLEVWVEAEGEVLDRDHLVYLRGFTEEDFFRFAPESRIAEFVDGLLVMHSPVKKQHDGITNFLECLLRLHTETKGLGSVHRGPFSVRLRPGLAREPDVFFVTNTRSSALTESYFDGGPDVVIEVVSEGTRKLDYETKKLEYERAGVREYWIVDPAERVVLVLVNSMDGFRNRRVTTGWVESSTIAGFKVPAEKLWEDDLPKVLDAFHWWMAEDPKPVP